MADLPPIRYAQSGEVNIAYRTFGDGPDVVITPAATVTMDVTWPVVEAAAAQGARVTGA